MDRRIFGNCLANGSINNRGVVPMWSLQRLLRAWRRAFLKPSPDGSRFRLSFERLEDRTAPAQITADVSYLDLFWSYFNGRPFGVAGVDGFSANQVDTTGVAIGLASAAPQGANVLNLASGQGSYFVAGEPIVVGAAGVYQTFTITGIAGDQLRCATPVSVASGFAAGTPVDHVWGNDCHPVSALSYAAWAQAIMNARPAEHHSEFSTNDPYLIQNPGNRPIVVLGDSWTVNGFPELQAAIQTRYPAAQVINAGIGGQTLQLMAARIPTDVLPYDPAYVILGTGMMNDLTDQETVNEMEVDLQSIISQCQAAGIPLIIPGVAPSTNPNILGGLAACASANEALRAIADAAGSPTVILIDIDATTATHPISVNTAPLPPNVKPGPGIDTLVVSTGQAETLNITQANGGMVGAVAFANMADLTGGSAEDTSRPDAGGAISGRIDRDGGVNTLDDSATSASLTSNITGKNTGAIVGGILFTNIGHLIGVSGSNTFPLANGVVMSGAIDGSLGNKNTFTVASASESDASNITGNNAGRAQASGHGAVAFLNMANLVGDNGNTFYFTNASNLRGKIDGGDGADKLDYSACTIPVLVKLTTIAATGVHGAGVNGFRNIELATGGPDSNLLFGPDSNNTLVLTGANVGNIIAVFAFLRHARWRKRNEFGAGSAAELSGITSGHFFC
jgi:hypothetical protein